MISFSFFIGKSHGVNCYGCVDGGDYPCNNPVVMYCGEDIQTCHTFIVDAKIFKLGDCRSEYCLYKSCGGCKEVGTTYSMNRTKIFTCCKGDLCNDQDEFVNESSNQSPLFSVLVLNFLTTVFLLF